MINIPYDFIRTKIENMLFLWHYRQNSLTRLSYIDIYISFLAQRFIPKSRKQLFGLWIRKEDHHDDEEVQGRG